MPTDRRRREENIGVVREYLKQTFPGHEVLDIGDFDQDPRSYSIRRGTALAHRVLVDRSFLDDHPAADIVAKLQGWDAAATIKAAGTRLVLIAEGGVTVAPDIEIRSDDTLGTWEFRALSDRAKRWIAPFGSNVRHAAGYDYVVLQEQADVDAQRQRAEARGLTVVEVE
ncbi:MAG TPA: hypothetical protein VFE48_22320 [Methylomirabilota bacterium]|nr:hypothetical protein [Methylomirabilota bacterium]